MSTTAANSIDTVADQSSDSPSAYQTDFYAWTQQQAALLRARHLESLDIENIAEEIESLGRSEKRELESRFTVLLMHLLKWQYQSGERERHGRSWLATIRTQRTELRKLMRDNPSLKAQFDSVLQESYQDARYQAEAETGLNITAFPDTNPYLTDQLFDPLWLPD